MKHKINKKILICAFAMALCCAYTLSLARFDAACEDLRQNVLRMHILANSDSAADQQLKLKVRDKVLEYSKTLFAGAKSQNEALLLAGQNIDKIEKAAQSVCDSEKSGYKVSAKVSCEYFDTRYYENFTLPAGRYKAVRLLIGKAQGENWWCVMYPGVCIGSSTKDKFVKAAGKNADRVVKSGKKLKAKFKIVEIIENLKKTKSKQKTRVK